MNRNELIISKPVVDYSGYTRRVVSTVEDGTIGIIIGTRGYWNVERMHNSEVVKTVHGLTTVAEAIQWLCDYYEHYER